MDPMYRSFNKVVYERFHRPNQTTNKFLRFTKIEVALIYISIAKYSSDASSAIAVCQNSKDTH